MGFLASIRARLVVGIFALIGVLPSVAATPSAETGAAGSLSLFRIAAQPLSTALEQFAATSHIQIFYDRPAGGDPASPGVNGRFTNARALEILLQGTGLAAHFNGPGDVVLGPLGVPEESLGAQAPPPIGVPMLSLDTLHVPSQAPAADYLAKEFYVQLIRSTVQQALLNDRRTSSGQYRVTLKLWISPTGQIRNPMMAQGTGSADQDAAILLVLADVRLSAPMPAGLQQPVLLGIHSRAPS